MQSRELSSPESGFSSTANVKRVKGSLWDQQHQRMIRTLLKKFIAKDSGVSHELISKLIPLIQAQFYSSARKNSKSSTAAYLTLAALNYALCLDYKFKKVGCDSNENYHHRHQIRLLLLALLVLICKKIKRYVSVYKDQIYWIYCRRPSFLTIECKLSQNGQLIHVSTPFKNHSFLSCDLMILKVYFSHRRQDFCSKISSSSFETSLDPSQHLPNQSIFLFQKYSLKEYCAVFVL